jgi:hypothetical protein
MALITALLTSAVIGAETLHLQSRARCAALVCMKEYSVGSQECHRQYDFEKQMKK